MKIPLVAVLAALCASLCMAFAAAGPAAWAPIPIPISEAQRMDMALVQENEAAEDRSLSLSEEESSRTFGGPRKRLMMLLPIMYKLGVITTMLGVLVFLTVKSVGIGLLLLALGAANLATVTKIKAATHHGGWEKVSYGGGPIHVHVHTSKDSGHHQAYASYHPPPSGPPPSYSSYSEPYPQEYHYSR